MFYIVTNEGFLDIFKKKPPIEFLSINIYEDKSSVHKGNFLHADRTSALINSLFFIIGEKYYDALKKKEPIKKIVITRDKFKLLNNSFFIYYLGELKKNVDYKESNINKYYGYYQALCNIPIIKKEKITFKNALDELNITISESNANSRELEKIIKDAQNDVFKFRDKYPNIFKGLSKLDKGFSEYDEFINGLINKTAIIIGDLHAMASKNTRNESDDLWKQIEQLVSEAQSLNTNDKYKLYIDDSDWDGCFIGIKKN